MAKRVSSYSSIIHMFFLQIQDDLPSSTNLPPHGIHLFKEIPRGWIKKGKIIEVAVKVIVAAFTAFLTSIITTSCMGYGPF